MKRLCGFLPVAVKRRHRLGQTVTRRRPLARLAGAALSEITLLAVALLLCHAGTARADLEQFQSFEVGGWRGGAYRTEEGTFSHCYLSRDYPGDITLGFGVTRWEEWQIVLGDDAWRLPEWTKFKVALSIDGKMAGRFSALVRAPRFLLINLGDRPDLYQQLRSGHYLVIDAAQQNFRFPLKGTSQALAKLRECADFFLTLVPRSVPDSRSMQFAQTLPAFQPSYDLEGEPKYDWNSRGR